MIVLAAMSEPTSRMITIDVSRLADRVGQEIGTSDWMVVSQEQINAFAIVEQSEDGYHSMIGITAPALERLEDGEIRSLLGHELGHFLAARWRGLAW